MRLIDADDFGNRMYHEAFEKDSDLQKWDSGCWIRYKLFENVLREQPTVQPDHNADIGKKAEGGCISRKTALDALAKQMPRSYTPDGSHPADEEIYKAQEIYADCIESIEILPAVQPEIIRCKDCKHHFVHRCMDSIPTEICDLNQTFYDAEVDFCSLAERRTE